jgi:hypothetical protein
MRFRADEVRFVDEQESLVSHADSLSYASAMNDEVPPFDSDPMMGIPMSSNEFGNNDF